NGSVPESIEVCPPINRGSFSNQQRSIPREQRSVPRSNEQYGDRPLYYLKGSYLYLRTKRAVWRQTS
ncbi:MAG: hypothetical protein LBQ77_04305, partial [Treponema sp.]|nr:hypothetical protein [Treponema sp.]